MLRAEDREKERRAEDHADRAPTVKGVQKAHDARLVFKGAGLDDRAQQHLDESASDRIENDGDDDADERIGEKLRQKRHQDESECGNQLRSHHAGAVSDHIGKFDRDQVNE